MSKYRMATLLAKKAYTEDFQEDIKLDLTDPLSQITLLLKTQSQGYAGGTTNRMPVSLFTKIEIIDGSDVLFSLTGKEAQAVDFYHNKVETLGETRIMNDGWSQSVVNINFGRWLWDNQLAFDATKFDSPILKITGDISAACVNADNARLTVLASAFHDKKINPSGFLMQKQIKSYDLADEGHEYTDMPRDYPYRKLFLRAQREGYIVSAQLKRIKLATDRDSRILFDELTDEMLTVMEQTTPPYEEWILGTGNTTSQYYPCTPCQRFRVVATPWSSTTGAGDMSTYEGGGGQFQLDMTAAINFQARVTGWCPHGVLEIPFGDQLDINDWLDVAKIKKSLQLDVTGDADTGSAQILLQQYRTYLRRTAR